MMSSKIWPVPKCVEVMMRCCKRILSSAEGQDRSTLLKDTIPHDAILWNIHLMGWGVYSLSKEVCEVYPQVNWALIMALGYGIEKTEVCWDIDNEVVWFLIEDVIPKLLPVLEEMQQTFSGQEEEREWAGDVLKVKKAS